MKTTAFDFPKLEPEKLTIAIDEALRKANESEQTFTVTAYTMHGSLGVFYGAAQSLRSDRTIERPIIEAFPDGSYRYCRQVG